MLYVYVNRHCTEDLFKVGHISLSVQTLSVNLETKECSCRKWLLTSLPCVHAIATMRDLELDFYQFVLNIYRKDKYEEYCRPIFYLVNGKSIWERTAYTDLQPPPIKRQPGRPEKKRNKDPSELKKVEGHMKRASYGTKCSRCHQPGHNKATRKLPPPPPPRENPPAATNPTDENQTSTTNQSTENPPPPPSNPLLPPPPSASNPPPATTPPVINQPSSQEHHATQASSNSQPVVATQGSSITQPRRNTQAKKQAAKGQDAKAQAAKGKAQAGSNSQGRKKRGPTNTTKTQPLVPNTKRQKLPFTRGPQGASGPPSAT